MRFFYVPYVYFFTVKNELMAADFTDFLTVVFFVNLVGVVVYSIKISCCTWIFYFVP